METIKKIKSDEGGYKSEIYLCTAGKLTWLYGRNIDDRPITKKEWALLRTFLKKGLTQKQWANSLFTVEVLSIERELLTYVNRVPEEVRAIIINMAYNMGTTRFNPKKWPKFFRAIKAKNWKQAAIEGRDSMWFRQVGVRSIRLMNSLEKVTNA